MDAQWNSGFTAVSAATQNGWQVEIAIPLRDLRVGSKPLRINLARRDATANAECELSATFGVSDLDHRVPMYRGDWQAVARFAPLRLEF